MGNNRPVEIKETDSTGRLLAREGGKIFIVGIGTAAAIFPLDGFTQSQQTKKAVLSTSPSATHTTHSGWLRLTQSLSWGTARTLAGGFSSLTKSFMVRTTTITQRNKLLHSEEKIFTEERLAEGIEESSCKKITSTQIIGIAGILGFVDTTLTHKFSNDKAWFFHQFLLQQQHVVFQIPKPVGFTDTFKIYKAGYPLRLTRNVLLIGGLLATTPLEDRLKAKTALSANQLSFVSATATGIVAGFLGNMLDIGYKNQVIVIQSDYRVPSSFSIFKKIVAESGAKGLCSGYGTFILSTVVVYNVIPRMEALATQTIPFVEKTIDSLTARFFSRKKPQSQPFDSALAETSSQAPRM